METLLLIALICVAASAAMGYLALAQGLSAASKRYHRYVNQEVRIDLRAQFIDLPPRQLLIIAGGLALTLFVTTILIFPVPFAIAAGFSGLAMPRLAVRLIKKHRCKKTIQQLPDALQSLAGALRAGTNLGKALELLALRQAPPISQEFSLVLSRQRFGETLDNGLAEFVRRVPSEETTLFRNAVVISHQVGGNLADTLERLSVTLRERSQMEARIKALTAMGRMQGRVMCILPLAIAGMLYLQQPEIMARLFTEPLGWGILLVVGIMMALAIISIKKIVTIDV